MTDMLLGITIEDIRRANKVGSSGGKARISVVTEKPEESIRVAASRSHKMKELGEDVEKLKNRYPHIDYVSSGSSLKFCLVAEGKAHIYPRLEPTMEWDTAAGQIIAEEAGAEVADVATGCPFMYNKQDLHNNYFISRRKVSSG